MQTEEDILDYWFEKRNLSTSTRDIYWPVHYNCIQNPLGKQL